MDYRSMNLTELSQLLRSRNVGSVHVRNELGKVYGVDYLPASQAKARDEAITLLEKYDSKKLSPSEIVRNVVVMIGVLASIATIITLILMLVNSSF